MKTRLSQARHATVWATAGFFAIGLAWIIALAPFTGSDEFDHGFRADAVAHGHLASGEALSPDLARGGLIPVRASVAAAARPACAKLHYPGAFNCVPFQELSGDEVLIASAASRYNPVFYAVIGTPARMFDGAAALYAMRLTSLVVCTGFFALAVRASLTGNRTRWPLVSVIVAALPTSIYSVSVAAPNGINMLAGLALWALVLALLRTTDEPTRPRWIYLGAILSGAVLVNTHTLGMVWLGLIVISFVVLTGPRKSIKALSPRAKSEWIGLFLLGCACVFEIAWVLTSRTNSLEITGKNHVPAVVIWGRILEQYLLWPLQALAAYPLRDQAAPLSVYGIGVALVVALIALAWNPLRRNKDVLRTVLFLVAMSYLLPTIATAMTYAQVGTLWQGRYSMPFTVGFFLLLGVALDRSGHRAPVPTWVAATVAIAWATAQILGPISVSLNQRLEASLTTSGVWSPPPVALLLALGVLATIAWWKALVTDFPESHPAPSKAERQDVTA